MTQVNLNEMCRICGDIFKDSFDSLENHQEIYKYLPIKNSDKRFSKNVCLECLSSISIWNDFYQKCEETQKKFVLLLREEQTILKRRKRKPSKVKVEITKKQCSPNKIKTIEPSDDLSLPCNFCKTRFSNQKELNDHLVAIHCDLVFCCDLCKNYQSRDDLITHMTEHALSSVQTNSEQNLPKSNKYLCADCEKTFNTKSGLKYHKSSCHSSTKKFPCTDCNQFFPCKRVLINHFRSFHSKDKSFECIDCGKQFKTDSTLYAHRKIHSKDIPHKCFECDKGFKFKHHLDVHLLQHKKKDNTYECNCCHKKFSALDNLTKHRKTHDKTMDFTCHICGVKMVQKRYLKDHMKKMHQTRLDSLA